MAKVVGGLVLASAIALAGCGQHGAPGSTASNSSTPRIAAATTPDAGWETFGYNAQHTGVGPSDTAITPANVGQLALRKVSINGIADSAAIELPGGQIVVTTSYGKTIAIDPGTGARLWEFVPRGVDSTPGDAQVTTATPVADPDGRYIYAASPNGVIHKLSVANGHQVWSRSITYDPRHEKLASALTISGRFVVAVTGGYLGDVPPYDGHVVTIYRSNGHIAHVWNTECSNRH